MLAELLSNINIAYQRLLQFAFSFFHIDKMVQNGLKLPLILDFLFLNSLNTMVQWKVVLKQFVQEQTQGLKAISQRRILNMRVRAIVIGAIIAAIRKSSAETTVAASTKITNQTIF